MSRAAWLQSIRDALYRWASARSGLAVIWDSSNGPRPEGPYVLLNMLSGPVFVGSDDQITHKEDDTFELRGVRRFQVQIDVFSNFADSDLSGLRDSLEDPSVVDELFSHGISVEDPGDVADNTAIRDTAFEGRATMTMVFTSRVDRETNLGAIEHVEIAGDLGPVEMGPEIIDSP